MNLDDHRPPLRGELESRLYGSVRRSVLWGREQMEIFKMLEVNGITGEAAVEMFRRARGERIAVLRSEATRTAVKGALFLAAAGALFCVFWFGLGAINRFVFVVCGLLAARGLWLLASGIGDFLLAPGKKGSVTPDND